MKTRSLALLLVAAGASLAGCGVLPDSSEPFDPCGSLPATGKSPDDQPRTAILIDVSASTRSASVDLAYPAYDSHLARVVEDAVNAKAWVSIGSFSGPGSVEWTVHQQPTEPEFSNASNRETQRTNTIDCLKGRLRTIVHQSPRSAGSDILGAISAAAAWVRDTAGAKRIVVATDGLATSGCAALVGAGFSSDQEIDAIADLCRDRLELAENAFAGVELTMLGVGHPAPDQPAATPVQRDWLRRLWTALCQTGNAHSCHIATDDPGRVAADLVAEDSIADPPVGFSSAWRFVLPDAVLFDTDDDRLRSGAETVLIRVAVQIRTLEDVNVKVYGHADARGDIAYNQNLSERRARTVAVFLRSHGVTQIESEGRGELEPLCTDQPPDDECLQQNRRVEIVAEKISRQA